jgi:hypothetical protein
MKNALPNKAKIAKEAQESMQECMSEFISFKISRSKLLSRLLYLHVLPFPATFRVSDSAVNLFKAQSSKGESKQRSGSEYGSVGGQ